MEKCSKYNLIFEKGDKFFLYNTLSTSIIEIDKHMKGILEEGTINEISCDIKKEFIENGIIVENDFDETAAYLYYYDKHRYADRLSSINITIVPTYRCNLACSYCSQGQGKLKKDNIVMSEYTATSIISFLKFYVKNSETKIKKIAVDFFGGEPLLAKNICIFLTKSIYDIAKSIDIEPIFSLTTNAVLLDQNVIDSLIKPYNFYIQLTVDGLKDQHNLKRRTQNGKGTFENSIKVLEMLDRNGLKDRIVLRAHIDKNNIFDAEKIINFYKDKTGDFYFARLKEYSGMNDDFATNCISNANCNASWDYITTKLILKSKFRYHPNFGKCMPCSLNSENTFFIDPFLDVYKCTPLLNHKKFRSGTISSDGLYSALPETYSQFNRSPKIFNKCLNCITMPTCGSGCAANAFFNNGDVNSSLCEASENLLIEYLKNYIQIQEEIETEISKSII